MDAALRAVPAFDETVGPAVSHVQLYAGGTYAFLAMRDAALRWAGGRSERWRVPIFDFLCNYRVSAGARLNN